MLMQDTLLQVLNAGGALDIDCSSRMMMPDAMVALASAAKAGGGHVTFRHLKMMMPDTAVRVAFAGSGHVTFVV